MKTKPNFTKKDFIVTFVSVVFLLANLAAIGTSGRRRAKEAVCLSNLQNWANIFKAFINDNNGFFMKGWYEQNGQSWFAILRPYYGEGEGEQDLRQDIKCCPEAAKCDKEDADDLSGSTFQAWGGPDTWAFIDGKRGDYGSYGTNTFINDHPGTGEDWRPDHWRRPDVVAADNIPLLLDCIFVIGAPDWNDEPPLYEGAKYWAGANGEGMGSFCINRHYGAINGLFMDFSARKIGLKELWLLKWHRSYDLAQARANEPDWTIGTGWMVPLKDYDYSR
jgi:hypothetical protein